MHVTKKGPSVLPNEIVAAGLLASLAVAASDVEECRSRFRITEVPQEKGEKAKEGERQKAEKGKRGRNKSDEKV